MLKPTVAKAVTKHTHHPFTRHSHLTNYSKTYQHVSSLHVPLLSTPATPKTSSLQCLVPRKPSLSPTRSTPDLTTTSSSSTKITAKTITIEIIPDNDDSKRDTSLCLAGATRGHESGVLKMDVRQAETWRGTYCLTGSRWIWESDSGSDGQRVSSWKEAVDDQKWEENDICKTETLPA